MGWEERSWRLSEERNKQESKLTYAEGSYSSQTGHDNTTHGIVVLLKGDQSEKAG